jgi:hypothetical protein
LAHIKKEGESLRQVLATSGSRFYLKEEEDLVEGLDEFADENAVDMYLLATRDTHLTHQYLKPVYRKTEAYHLSIPILNIYQDKKNACAGNCDHCHTSNYIIAAHTVCI